MLQAHGDGGVSLPSFMHMQLICKSRRTTDGIHSWPDGRIVSDEGIRKIQVY
jgi:hypothetical protein